LAHFAKLVSSFLEKECRLLSGFAISFCWLKYLVKKLQQAKATDKSVSGGNFIH